ncbi:ribosome biogenesis GTPase YlqF [Pseudostreptobacillus hongkongensis]|uniref:ribosome biogenesis GTPase YlqF n=1 Tax=Pseudostreptobacillus hongkongensis TaxID=1162717 RepID=UPI0028D71EDC|nr:ribosome biogenesis GTPase YlqF [Pseudostreptobacillus hongkongensis]
MSILINWYPGHMKKTRDMIIENLKIVDLVIEILDARIPISSKNPDIEELAKNKKRIVVLNKMDLVDESKLKEWKDYFIENNMADYFLTLSVEKNTNFSELRKIVANIYEEKLEKVKKKGLRKTVIRALIAGIPNVGKSKFINKFSNKNKAKVGNKPGFTRGKQWITVDEKFELLDTPGILWPKFEDQFVAFNLAITGSIKDDILPLEEVSNKLLDIMKKHGNINDLIRVYNLEVNDLSKFDNVEIFKILENRLGIHKTEEYSFEVISKRLLKEYRMGKLGRFLLEEPSDFRK